MKARKKVISTDWEPKQAISTNDFMMETALVCYLVFITLTVTTEKEDGYGKRDETGALSTIA